MLKLGKEKRRKKKKVTTAAKYKGLPITMGGHKNFKYRSISESAYASSCQISLQSTESLQRNSDFFSK